ncbi:DUF3592 domain-containing protein [Sphaerisporangium perillae]|uniref:DUF3592 domain-containing protein n=1 Tax=Sphaerisporangium perillae TaxID=2935860 RepID=UPI00200FF788|nr:DUF3592 domain-containing protein [Sphaerisporangium perillae]
MSDKGDVPLILGIIGTVLAVLGSAVVLHTRDFRRRARRAQAQVVRLRAYRTGASRRERRNSAVYHPVLRFTTAEGERVEAESPVGSNPPPARAGERVRILYDPADPAQVRIDSAMGGGMLLGGVFIGAGLLVLALGVRLGLVSALLT